MRDAFAALVAVGLTFFALSLLTTLYAYRRRRRVTRSHEELAGRAIIAEIPTESDLVLFTEDADAFHYGESSVAKSAITAVRVLINGSPIASYLSPRAGVDARREPTTFEDRPEGIARDRWDVAIESGAGVMLVECGAIRERVSQELARQVYDAVRDSLTIPLLEPPLSGSRPARTRRESLTGGSSK